MTYLRHRHNNRRETVVADWQAIYCSIALILVVFFVMLVSHSTADRMKMNSIKVNIKGVAMAHEDNNSQFTTQGGNNDVMINEAMHLLMRSSSYRNLKKDITLERSNGGFECRINADMLFKSGSAAINPNFYSYLEDIIDIAKDRSLFIRIEGHTDNLPLQGDGYASNWALSAERAVNILRYLRDNSDIPDYRLAAHGLGQFHPVAANDTAKGRAKNRRIEIFFELNPIYP